MPHKLDVVYKKTINCDSFFRNAKVINISDDDVERYSILIILNNVLIFTNFQSDLGSGINSVRNFNALFVDHFTYRYWPFSDDSFCAN